MLIIECLLWMVLLAGVQLRNACSMTWQVIIAIEPTERKNSLMIKAFSQDTPIPFSPVQPTSVERTLRSEWMRLWSLWEDPEFNVPVWLSGHEVTTLLISLRCPLDRGMLGWAHAEMDPTGIYYTGESACAKKKAINTYDRYFRFSSADPMLTSACSRCHAQEALG